MNKLFSAFLVLALLLTNFAEAQSSPASLQNTEKQSTPYTVIFGAYPLALYDFDTRANTFKIDFYAWWRTKDPNYHPEKSIVIVNAEKYTSSLGKRGVNGSEYFTSVHYYATIRQYWDPRNFPFDHQTLVVILEDVNDINHLLFEPDYEQSSIHPEFGISNWKILNFQLNKSITHYDSNFGDISTPKGLHSRLSLQIDIKHDGWVSYFNYFIAFFVTAFLSTLVFFLKDESLEVKLLLVISAVFAFIGNKYVIDSVITDVASYSLANVIQVATFIIMFSSIIFIITEKNIALKLAKKGKSSHHLVGYFMLTAYILSVGIATYYAVIS